MPKKYTPTQKAYAHELKRIKNFIRAAEKRGYTFSSKAYPEIPNRITIASVKKLKNIKPENLYKYATYTTPTGDTVKGPEGRKMERKAARAKTPSRPRKKKQEKAGPKRVERQIPSGPPRATDLVLKNIEALIEKFPDGWDRIWTDWQMEIHERHKNILRNVLNGQILMQGREAVAMRLQNAAADVHEMAFRMIYGGSKEDDFQIDIAWFAEILKGGKLSTNEAISVQQYADEYGL